jgi:pimeloyl-ACP methyl ester carboxylesterase
MLGISIGGTMALRAAEHEPSRVKAVVAISPDSHTAGSDAASYDFLQEQVRRGGSRRWRRRVAKLKPPPYLDPAAFQRRVRLLANLGTIEHGRTFGALLRETLVGMIAAYGIVGTVTALRNMNLVLRRLLPEIVSLDLFANPPRLTIPVHYVFGEQDTLSPPSIADRLPAATAAPGSTAVRVPDAGHMVHFDHPHIVRSIVERA